MARVEKPTGKAKGRDERGEILAALSRAPVFSSLGQAALVALALASKKVTLRARQALWTEGQQADHLALIVSGRLKVARVRRRKEVIVDVAGAGDVLGEVAFSLQAKQQFEVRCLRRAVVVIVPAMTFRRLLEARPRAAAALALDLAQQVVRLSRRVESLSSGNVEQRVARVVLGLAERFGQPFPGGLLVPVRLRREDLASMAATALESASRRVAAWKREGIILQQPAGFVIRDMQALNDLVTRD